jgi:hypothetical protein
VHNLDKTYTVFAIHTVTMLSHQLLLRRLQTYLLLSYNGAVLALYHCSTTTVLSKGGLPVKALLPTIVVAVLFAFFVMSALSGCQPTSVTPVGQLKPQDKALSDEQSAMLQEILEFQRNTGQGMSQLLADLEAQRAAESAAKGPHPLVLDLAVAQQLAAEAQKTDDSKQLTTLLRRLQSTIISMMAETPAGMMVRQLERARLALALEQPSAEDLSQASKALMGALNSGLDIEPPELVPPVLTRLEAAKKKLDEGDAGAARQLIIEAQEQASGHQLHLILRKALAAVKGAEEALNRDAPQVVKAEVAELAAMLDKVTSIAVVKTVDTTQESASSPTADTTPQAPSTSSEPSEPASVPAQPAPTATPAAPEHPTTAAPSAPDTPTTSTGR